MPLRLIGALAAVLTVVLSGVLGRIAAPERRSAPLLTAGTAAVCVATPLFGGTVVNGELFGLPFLVGRDPGVRRGRGEPPPGAGGSCSAVAAGAAGAVGALVKQSMVDVFVVAVVAAVHQRGGARQLPALLAGALVTVAVVVAAAWAAGHRRPPTSGTPS